MSGQEELGQVQALRQRGEKILSYLTSWEELRQDGQLPKLQQKKSKSRKNDLLLQLVRGRPEARLPGRLNARPQKA